MLQSLNVHVKRVNALAPHVNIVESPNVLVNNVNEPAPHGNTDATFTRLINTSEGELSRKMALTG